jgi:hypothetical protein
MATPKNPPHGVVSIKIPLEPGMDPADWNSSNTSELKLARFDQDGAPEYLAFCKNLEDLIKRRGIEGGVVQQLHLTKSLLGSGSLGIFNEFYEQLEADNLAADPADQVSADDMLKLTMNKLAHEAFSNPTHAYHIQKRYMKRLVMDTRVCPSKFIDALVSMNKSLRYFPYDESQDSWEPLDEQSILDIIDDAKDYSWDVIMRKQGKEPWDLDTISKARTYYKNLYESEEVQRQLNDIKMDDTPDKKSSFKKRKANDDDSEKENKNKNKNQNKKSKKCEHCSRLGHNSEDCWELEQNSDKRPKGYKIKGEETKPQPHMAALKTDFDVAGEIERDQKRLRVSDQVTISNSVSSPLPSKERKNKKVTFQTRKRKAPLMEAPIEISETDYQIGCPMVALTQDTTTEDTVEDNSNSENEFDGYLDVPGYLLPFFDRSSLNKKTKLAHYTAEIVVEILDKNGKLVPIRALLDTGTTSTLVLRDFVKKGRAGGYKGTETNLEN